ncbi:MAG: formylmethanofuran dehydrogenase [Gammaproteobacteria bacterium]|nr:formylmethanofuran dehydrogenase [Gammaproteobacteria bacterium]
MSTTIKDVTCPFCGLHCDDLMVAMDGDTARVVARGCDRAVSGFAQSGADPRARVQGLPVTLDQAVKHAARVLKRSHQPLIAGMATDASGCRAALALAEKTGAAVDHMHGHAVISNALVVQRRGWIMTTLTELRNRADLVLLLGTDGDSVNPRFTERCLQPRPTMGRKPRRSRQVAVIGAAALGRSLKRQISSATSITCRPNDLPEMLSVLRATLSGQAIPLPRKGPHAGRMPALKKLAARLRSAHYAVVAWAPGQLASELADIVIEGACELVADLNRFTRAAGLSLGGSDGAITALNVCAWQTGYPLRVNFAGGAPEYNPSRNACEALLERREADALLWISTLHPLPPPQRRRIPTIILAPPSRRLAALAEVFIPVAIPGLDAAGTMFRLDNVVGLPLRAVRGTTLPGAADVLNQIRGCI